MGQGQGAIEHCPICNRPQVFLLPPGGAGPRTFQCFDCDRQDALAVALTSTAARQSGWKGFPARLSRYTRHRLRPLRPCRKLFGTTAREAEWQDAPW
jgi:hypothetical protein